MLLLHDLGLAYPGQPSLRYGDRQLAAGEQVLLLGPSGAGKSTLLHLIAGLQTPTTGRVEIEGAPISQWSEAARDRFRGRRLGVIFQRLHLLASLSVRDNLLLAQRCAGLPETPERADTLLETLGLAALADRKPHALSGGQQQRVAIARALMNRPALVLADEPTASLDDVHAGSVLDLLQTAVQREGAALILASHDARAQARFAQRWELSP